MYSLCVLKELANPIVQLCYMFACLNNGNVAAVEFCEIEILFFCLRIPHRTKRGVAALARLKIYEGVPSPYDKVKRMVILDTLNFPVWFRPDALKVLRLQSGHKFLLIGPSIILRLARTIMVLLKSLRQRNKKKGHKCCISLRNSSYHNSMLIPDLGSFNNSVVAQQVGSCNFDICIRHEICYQIDQEDLL
ncbi:unnamed protein product [Arabis nemorensis]|uniref:Uncharacterized protein n=1 Tax=Arabis nemorensis TaxID=586526 RepID=A0A565CLC5_9BRAS|nr:unnamed protein product [Arabis nemorensis]